MKRILITGGAGFIGTNAAFSFQREGWQVSIVDNLSRAGSESNLRWLNDNCDFRLYQIDVRNQEAVDQVIREERPHVVLHLAGQVAVTTSVATPRDDFEINACGTFNVLEAVRCFSKDTFVINASTNKVYGGMEDLKVIERKHKYEYCDLCDGVDENRPLDFHSPYGCSKGAGDQYTIDYARIYGIRTTTFRQSCIYGPRQFGIEDQGWVAWFAITSCRGNPITVYGDGKQVRDVLHVTDLIAAYKAAIAQSEQARGQAFNIGGGAENVLSLLELVGILEQLLGRKVELRFEDWRPGDQRVYVSNIAKAKRLLGWYPKITVRKGVQQLLQWVEENKNLFMSQI